MRLPLTRNQQYFLIAIAVLVVLYVIFVTGPATLIGRAIGLIIGFTIHEYAHAYTALRLGDRTAYFQGRVSLDPRVHLEPLGMVLALIAGFGWAKPVPVNTRAFYPHERQGLMIVALAGPVSNVILGIIFGIGMRLADVIVPFSNTGVVNFFYDVLATIIFFNLVLFFFNLIPLSPLDGWKIMIGLLPPEQAYEMSRYEQQSTTVLLLLLLFGLAIPGLSIFGAIILPPVRFLFQLITGF